MIHNQPQHSRAEIDANRTFALAEKLRMNATLLRMMIDGEVKLSRRHLRSLVADLQQHATEADRLERRSLRALEVVFQAERAA